MPFVLATAVVTVVLALPPLRRVGEQISRMSLAWIGVAVMLEIASCAAYVVIFRLFFAEVPADLARRVAWTEEGSGALLPTGGSRELWQSEDGCFAKPECRPRGLLRARARCSF